MSEDPAPSLVGRMNAHSAARPWLWLAIAALLVLMAVWAIVATVRANAIRAETQRMIAEAPSPAAAEAETEAMARAFAHPRIATTLADLAAHLTADAPLAEAARGRDGTLRIAIDTADPDELRAVLAGDPWFERFHERAQEARTEGRIRVTLVEAGE